MSRVKTQQQELLPDAPSDRGPEGWMAAVSDARMNPAHLSPAALFLFYIAIDRSSSSVWLPDCHTKIQVAIVNFGDTTVIGSVLSLRELSVIFS